MRVSFNAFSEVVTGQLGDLGSTQLRLQRQATSGQHTLRARSVDRTGQTQTDQRRDPVPSGASGWHEIVVIVS